MASVVKQCRTHIPSTRPLIISSSLAHIIVGWVGRSKYGTYFWIDLSCKNALNGAIPEPAAASMIGFDGSKGGLNVVVLLTVARRGDPGVRDDRYDVAVPRKSPWPDRCGWAMMDIVIVHLEASCRGDDEIEY